MTVSRYRVLFVDDDELLLNALGEYFERLGHDVYKAGTGQEGLELFKRIRPDVAVLDLYMPDMSGMQVLEAIRQDYPEAMVLLLTGYGEVETAVEAMRLGAENFLTKPIDMPHLQASVEKAAEKAALRQENVELRARLKPNVKRRIMRWGAVVLLLFAAAAMGRFIGGGAEDVRPTQPIPVPIEGDTAIN